jgi:hypothetical protein
MAKIGMMLIAAAAPAAAAAETAPPGGTAVEAAVGVQLDEGDYGTGERVRTVTAPVSLQVRKGRVRLGASLGRVRVDAPANIVGGGGLLGIPILIDPNRPSTRQTRQGLGDLRVGASYDLPTRAIGVTLSGEAKLPTASRARGLGTGKADYAVGAEISKRLGPVVPFVGLGYSMPGDPARYRLRDGLTARGGAAVQVAPSVRAQMSYGYARSPSPLLADQQQLASGVDAALGRRLSFGAFGAAGLSKGSPDLTAGLRLGIRIR